MNNLVHKLQDSYSEETCHHSYRNLWSPEHPEIGHCAVASLMLAKYCGYAIYKVKVGRRTHYYNVDSDGTVIDATSAQFECLIDYSKGVKCSMKNMLQVCDTAMRFVQLENRVVNVDA